MLSSVLKTASAREMNVAIMRTFIALRKVAANYKEIMQIVAEMRNQYDTNFKQIFNAFEQSTNPPQQPRKRIGFKPGD